MTDAELRASDLAAAQRVLNALDHDAELRASDVRQIARAVQTWGHPRSGIAPPGAPDWGDDPSY